ncbi:hypothetical protein E0H36_08525 [Rhizobium leguminosarum bv. viciae]|uniref:hypothetical protein n=1 Tax=Rhizobium leguminosarum TaxID=384 RepID=UPI00103E6A40|nr:hypothetical protein [Rhizobium leguminosarum]MBY5484425.1 hypothetical protein [Rhizobium leguminosarum]TBZ34484.1 hypothetical protein E0H36_08525 [Rhizobium leguminosarum bv. viciae]
MREPLFNAFNTQMRRRRLRRVREKGIGARQLREARGQRSALRLAQVSTLLSLIAAIAAIWGAISSQRQAESAVAQINLSERNSSIQKLFDNTKSYCESMYSLAPESFAFYRNSYGERYLAVVNDNIRGLSQDELDDINYKLRIMKNKLADSYIDFFMWNTDRDIAKQVSEFLSVFPEKIITSVDIKLRRQKYGSYHAATLEAALVCTDNVGSLLAWLHGGMKGALRGDPLSVSEGTVDKFALHHQDVEGYQLAPSVDVFSRPSKNETSAKAPAGR